MTLKKSVAAGAATAALAGGLALAAPANATELVTVCPDQRSGVARSQTSCPFAHNVHIAWLTQPGYVVDAYSPVTGDVYDMQCGTGFEIYLDNGMTVNAVRCVGGNNAVVWVW